MRAVNFSALVVFALASPPAAAGGAHPAAAIRQDAIQAHVEFLAGDLLEGRLSGTRGYDLAAAYVASQFRLAGLQPAGEDGSYFQHFDLLAGQSDLDASRLVLRNGDREIEFDVRDDYLTWGSPLTAEEYVEAPLVFAGYGISAAELDFDDMGQVDLRGKVAVVLTGAPATFPNSQRAYYSSSRLKYARLKKAGAVGVIAIATRVDQERVPWERTLGYTWWPSRAWRGADGRTSQDDFDLPVVTVRTPSAAPFFEGAPHSLEQVLDAADEGRALAFELPGRVEIRSSSELSEARTSNVLGVLPGSDPALGEEYVIITAHLDHVGIGQEVEGDAIYNGAWDNATGIAVMLEIARVMSEAGAPRRSILYAAVGAEESGLLGSDYFAEHPTVPLESIIANINIDMPYAPVPTKDFVAFGAEHTTLGPLARAAAGAEGYTLSPDPIPEEVIFVRSDQFAFVQRGIPAIYIDGGYIPVDPAHDLQALAKEFLKTHYHRPSDDLSRPIPYENLAGLARVNTRILMNVANDDARAAWNPGDFFGRTFDGPMAAP